MPDINIYEQKQRSNKKVIIVGNSRSILLHEFGEIIDSYDIVIRVNRCVTKGFEKHVGKKIDIWSTTTMLSYEDFYPENYKKIKYLWTRTKKANPDTKWLKLPKDFPSWPRKNRYIMYKQQKHYMNYDNFLKPFKLEKEPCTGLLTILTACRFFENITVHGFTFGTQNTSNNRVTGYYRESELDKNGEHPEDIFWFADRNLRWANKKETLKRRNVLKKLVEEGIPKKSKGDKYGFEIAHPKLKILNKAELEDMSI